MLILVPNRFKHKPVFSQVTGTGQEPVLLLIEESKQGLRLRDSQDEPHEEVGLRMNRR